MRMSVASIAQAVWKMINQSSRTARGTQDILHGTVSFGTGENTHSSSIAGLNALNINEIEFHFNGPFDVPSSTGGKMSVGGYVDTTAQVTFVKQVYEGSLGATGLSSTHYYVARRIVR